MNEENYMRFQDLQQKMLPFRAVQLALVITSIVMLLIVINMTTILFGTITALYWVVVSVYYETKKDLIVNEDKFLNK